MTRGPHIRAIGADGSQTATNAPIEHGEIEPTALEDEGSEIQSEQSPGRRLGDWLIPLVAVVSIASWSVFFGWAMQPELSSGGNPQMWVEWGVNWSIPVVLIATFWLLTMRMSRREANRFGDAAVLLRQESQALEGRLVSVNRELSLAREFLASQSRELESLGRLASERISANAQTLQSLIASNGAQVETIASVSDTALANMGKLRDDLPVIANSARDVSNQIGQAGRSALDQLEKLIAGFDRLNDFGRASGRQVNSLSEQIQTTLEKFEEDLNQISQSTEDRFEALAAKNEEFRLDLDRREIDCLASMRHRADELKLSLAELGALLAQEADAGISILRSQVDLLREDGTEISASLKASQDSALAALDAHKERLDREFTELAARIDQIDQLALAAGHRRMDAFARQADELESSFAARDAKFEETIARRQDEFETREAQASEILAQRLTQLDEMLAERKEAQIHQLQELASQGSSVAAKADELASLLSTITALGESTRLSLDEGMSNLAERLVQSRNELAEAGRAIDELTDAGVRLLEIIQSGARETHEILPKAIEQATARLGEVEQRSLVLRENVEAANRQGSGLNDYVIAARETIAHATGDIEAFHQRLVQSTRDGQSRLHELRQTLEALEHQSVQAADRSGEDLRAAIVQLEEAARHAFAAIETGSDEQLAKLADELGTKASAAIEQSLRSEGLAAVERLEAAAMRASGAGRDIAVVLRDQLSKVNELAANLEQRVARAHDLAQEKVDNDFARRMALITESLNSNAIDIAKVMSQDVTDTAWASYLKGDRGIFTRRAVRLVDNADARDIMQLYETMPDFRDHVSRYIHDFESMLRSVLSTRDGNALGVTLLSSDMGKLYVVLAQAIERLRS